MLDIQQPISRLAIAVHAQKETSIAQNQVHFLINTIQKNLTSKNLGETINSLLPTTYELRVAFSNSNKPSNTEDLQHYIIKEITAAYQRQYYPQLNETIADALAIYLQIATPTLTNIGSEKAIKNIAKLPENYATFKAAINYIPLPSTPLLLKFMEASLQFETALLMADLLNLNLLKQADAALADALRKYIKRSISHFGAYAELLNIWTPKEDDYAQPLVNNMRILSAKIRVDNGLRNQKTSFGSSLVTDIMTTTKYQNKNLSV